MNIQITKKQLQIILEQNLTPKEQLEKFNMEEEKIKSRFMSKKNVIKWKTHLDSKYPNLSFRLQIGNDVLIAQASINQ